MANYYNLVSANYFKIRLDNHILSKNDYEVIKMKYFSRVPFSNSNGAISFFSRFGRNLLTQNIHHRQGRAADDAENTVLKFTTSARNQA
jgi:hypothetical protein